MKDAGVFLGVLKNDYIHTLYFYMANIILKNPPFQVTRALWCFVLQRYFTGKLSWKELCYAADELYYVLNDPRNIEDEIFSGDLFVLTDQDESEESEELREMIWSTYCKMITHDEFRIDLNRLENFQVKDLSKEDSNHYFEQVVNEYKKGNISSGELSVICTEILQKNQDADEPFINEKNSGLLTMAAHLLPLYYFDPSEAMKLKKSIEQSIQRLA